MDFKTLYALFGSPVSVLDCGRKCAPYNEYSVPFCCDIKHTVPTAYSDEWVYLRSNSDLWHLWDPDDPDGKMHLESETPEGQVLIECLGHEKCERNYRTITCRAFPFAPYINSDGDFIGIVYYWKFEDRCWVISNLDMVTRKYRQMFLAAYDYIFSIYPRELNEFRYHSNVFREVFVDKKRAIPLLHRNGHTYKISPMDERMGRVDPKSLPKHGPYKIADAMPFPDEITG